MKSNAKKQPVLIDPIERAKQIQALESEHAGLMNIYYYIQNHLARSNDDIIKSVAERKAKELMLEVKQVKEKIDAA